MSATIDDVYDDLHALLQATVVSPPGGARYKIKEKSLIIPLAALKADAESWGAQFREALTDNKTRAWFFTKIDDAWLSESAKKDMRDALPYHVVQIRFYMAKREGTFEDNSDRDFQRECDAVVRELNRNPRTMPAALSQTLRFSMKRNYKLLGTESTHFAWGNLFVQWC